MSKCENCGNELRTCGKCGWSKVYEEDVSHLKAEIERLKEDNRLLHVLCDERQARAMDYLRAYEVLEKGMQHFNMFDNATLDRERAGEYLAEAQRIKDGDGEQG